MKIFSLVHVLFSTLVHYSLQITTSSLFKFKGHLPEEPDDCAFEVKTLNFQSKGLCAVFCYENLFCNAFDTCFSGGASICRLRYGNADATTLNSFSQCDHYEMITSTYCPDGFFLRSHGVCITKYNNLALHGPTTMSSVFDDPNFAYQRHGNGSLAVNGEVQPDDTECAVSNRDPKPFLTIDLQDHFFIGRVVFTNRLTNVGRLHDLNVTISRDGSTFDCFCGFFKGPGTPHQRVDMRCQESCKGRFVRLQIMLGPEYLQLCEVEVYSNCY